MKHLLLTIAVLLAAVPAIAANTATITFTAAVGRADGSAITGALSYEVHQGLKGAAKTKVGTITTTSATITTGLVGGKEYCWDVVTIEAGNPSPSPHSTEACKAFDLAAPNVVTITVQ